MVEDFDGEARFELAWELLKQMRARLRAGKPRHFKPSPGNVRPRDAFAFWPGVELMTRRSWYVTDTSASDLAAVVNEIHHASQGRYPKHLIASLLFEEAARIGRELAELVDELEDDGAWDADHGPKDEPPIGH